MEAFDGEFGVEPVLLAFGIIADIGVSHGRQFTGGVLGGMSGGAGAVHDDLGVLVRDQGCSESFDLVGRQVFCRRNMCMLVCVFGQRFEKREFLAAVELGL
jgi:hypothetical protein